MIAVELEGIITRVCGRDLFTYTLHDGKRSAEFAGREFFQPGESVRASCSSQELFGKPAMVAEKMEKIGDLYDEIERKVSESAKLDELKNFDETIGKMKDDFEKIAGKIYAAQQLGRFVTVRFHGDADGISSALILKKFLRANYIQQNSAVYSVGDAIRDLEKMGQQFKPLLIFVDLGSGEDSEQGLGLLKAGGIEIMGIDHHPPAEGTKGDFSMSLNSWNAGVEDGSKYPAGFLCSMLAGMFGVESNGLEKIACAGDKSGILQISEEDEERALVLDFVAAYSGHGNSADIYSGILSNKTLFDSMLLQANAKMEETDALVRKNMKKIRAGGVEICTLNLDNIAEKREFPGKGKITGRMLDLVGGKTPMVAIGYAKKSVIFRLNDEAVSNGIKANGIIEKMKQNFSDFVENGGGHARAAALRIKEGFENAAMEEIIKIIESW